MQVYFQSDKEGVKEATLTMKTDNELILLNLTGEIIYPVIQSNIGNGETIKLKAGKSFKLHLRN